MRFVKTIIFIQLLNIITFKSCKKVIVKLKRKDRLVVFEFKYNKEVEKNWFLKIFCSYEYKFIE